MVLITAADVFSNPVVDLSFAPNELPIMYIALSIFVTKEIN